MKMRGPSHPAKTAKAVTAAKAVQLDLVEYLGGEARPKKSHLWKMDPKEHYVEPGWVTTRLFEEEPFTGNIVDPCCGWGNIPEAAKAAGYVAFGSDLINRGYVHRSPEMDFLAIDPSSVTNISNCIFNPPFKLGREFVEQALKIATKKVAAIVPVRRLNAMGKWLDQTPLYRVWMMTPRPSMPPGEFILKGGKVGGGTVDFCWCVFLQNYDGRPTIEWLHRDKKNQHRLAGAA